ncbi:MULTISPECIES: manno-octulosonate cytidylyltransferase [unclassified Novosphingobium]|uniref:3-deoxy-manno-octulosonate cytidylyltransferase n=1 Tax=unclassified Novosphingobium TaxID=2644732 RepID=UPI00146A5395|nr:MULTISPECIES: manno-octulosonate cytidylyltransferase [unclassified Novosphingobium]NMN03202.1 3-deoxy-manno-octulosonate cytidylyltransferase (CMP-KDO synthetase) [Novosphingobium sp. SG919]NMN86808.1 3-deoxy-manno-octulosonate cytidylyltransferase (CMP-KDO synthetase) [Novosphingobium sp. SG916]
MSSPAQALIVVPARFGSKRLPGKPLLPIAGRTLLERVHAVAQAAAALVNDCSVVVATDDARIADHARAIGAAVVLTDPALDSGSARAYAAAMAQPQRPDLVINLQGDAPFVPPAVVAGLVAELRDGEADVATPVYRLDWARLDRLRQHKVTAPFSGTTCVRDAQGRALWFSKTILPAMRDEDRLRASQSMSPVWQHLGLYGYRLAALEWFARAPQSPVELLEGLEQLRFLEAGRTIATIAVDPPLHAMSGIDTPADLALAEAAIARLGDPFPT